MRKLFILLCLCAIGCVPKYTVDPDYSLSILNISHEDDSVCEREKVAKELCKNHRYYKISYVTRKIYGNVYLITCRQ